jgi:hypothetical protein
MSEKAIEECMREYIDDGGDKEVHLQAVAELMVLKSWETIAIKNARDANAASLAAYELRGELAQLRAELAHLRAAWNEAKGMCEAGLSFHADCFGFTSWLEKYGELK